MRFFLTHMLLLVTFVAPAVWPHGDAEEVSASVGPGMAVVEADPTKGFRLSESAWKRLVIETQDATLGFPKESWVHVREEYGVYRYRDGFFKWVEGDLVAGVFQPKESFLKGDHVAIGGVPLLRVTDLDLFGSHEDEEKRHDHD
jgi:hypothetical protein